MRALMDRDAAVERWLREGMMTGHQEYLDDPSKGVPAADVLGRIKARRAARGQWGTFVHGKPRWGKPRRRFQWPGFRWNLGQWEYVFGLPNWLPGVGLAEGRCSGVYWRNGGITRSHPF